ncbi:unnamed protein product [Clonostachys byssicola]|uniref:Something about silencing protein 4 domain-containing protein n=1 Tax=Clonostachys byssicola TaxID=160290 RepID=A0A9N9UIG4_9HYPO|nr:unnamed protein product [Clonostachys byssicola]
MASVTRSSRRADSRKYSFQKENTSSMRARTAFLQHAPNANVHGGGGGGRTKRHLDVNDFDTIIPKKTRISLEILPPKHPAISSHDDLAGNHAPADLLTGGAVGARGPTQDAPAQPAPTPHAATTEQNLTKHQSKVTNGIKHELDRLQSQPADTKETGRKLRSQEAARRFKSELSAYFPEYDEVMGNEAKEQHLLNVDTPIVVIDSIDQQPPQSAVPQQSHFPTTEPTEKTPVRGYGDALYTDLFDTQRIDFGFLVAHDINNKTLDDPLADSLFEPAHKRAERVERSIRNTEKGRAQHERDQIVRLLDSLLGHDWLRVLGVNSIIDAKKKEYEPARQYFIKGCQNILAKFRNWSLEEKRRKQERDRMLAERAEEEESDSDSEPEQEESTGERKGQARSTSESSSCPAKQLREEAMARSKVAAKAPKRSRPTAPRPPPKPPGPPKEFTSFFSKKYERDSALHHHRRAGRKVLAWGHPVPDVPESDFMLPEVYRDAETLRMRARQKRRDKRSTRN